MYVYADSTNRDTLLYPSGNSYTLHLTTPAKSVTQVDLVAAKVPNSMYNITNGNNIITVSTVSYSIPVGFYSAYGIADALASRIGLTVKYLPDEGRLWFFNSTADFTLQINTLELQKLTGFSSNSIYTSQLNIFTPAYANGPNGYFIKSDNVVDMSINEFVFLDIDELRTPQVTDSKALVGETYSGRNIRSTFAMIPMDVGSGCIKDFKEGADYIISITYPQPIAKLSRLTVRWYDKTGQLLNFNGFENNAFVLRVHEAEVKEEEEPKETSITELELRRLIESLIPPPPPPKPEVKRIMVPRYLMYLILAIMLGFGCYMYFRKVPAPGTNALPQLPTRLPEPLRVPAAPRLI
jgi:hypothetical protein